MGVLGVVLSLCAFASAAVPTENAQLETSAEFNLGSSYYDLALTAPNTDILTENDVAALYNSLSVQDRSVIATQIENLLEGFREVVINGSDQVPVLDPFVVDHLGPFLITASGFRGSGNVRNLRVEGLRWFIIDRVSFSPLRLTLGLQITVPWITVTGQYDAQASVLLVTHRAGGNFRVFVNRLVVGVDARLGTSLLGGHLLLRNLDIKIDIHDTNIHITGMTGSSLINTFINSFVQTLTQEAVQNHLDTASKAISEQLFDVINEILRDFTLDDLLG